MLTRELTDFLPWQWARDARLTGQKVRSNDGCGVLPPGTGQKTNCLHCVVVDIQVFEPFCHLRTAEHQDPQRSA